MRKVLFGAVLAAVALSNVAPTSAAEAGDITGLTKPGSVIDSVSTDNISEILREMGAQQIEVHDAGKMKVVTFVESNVPYNLGITLCDIRPGKCVGLVLIVAMDTGTLKFPLELINSHNKDNIFAAVTQIDSKKIGIGHALLIDSGVTKKNLAMNIGTFAISVQEAMKYLASQFVASNEKGGATPFEQVKFEPEALHPVPLSPEDITRLANAISEPYKAKLRAQP
jgi:hypothetical protein